MIITKPEHNVKGKRIKISKLHEEKTRLAFPKLKTSAKSVQTTAEVSRKYYVLTNLCTRTYDNKYVYLLKCLRVLTKVFTSYLLW